MSLLVVLGLLLLAGGAVAFLLLHDPARHEWYNKHVYPDWPGDAHRVDDPGRLGMALAAAFVLVGLFLVVHTIVTSRQHAAATKKTPTPVRVALARPTPQATPHAPAGVGLALPADGVTPGGHKPAPLPPALAAELRKPGLKPGVAGAMYVKDVTSTDSDINVAALLNQTARADGISAVGLASVYGAECAIKTGMNGDCNRIQAWPDWSAGGCQVTVQTAGVFGVGHGIQADQPAVFAYENAGYHDAAGALRCIRLMAAVLVKYRTVAGVDFPLLYAAWNCGPYADMRNLPPQCAGNYRNYLQWWSWAGLHASATDPYVNQPAVMPQRAFNRALFESWRVKNGLPAVQPYCCTLSPYVRLWNDYQGLHGITGKHSGGDGKHKFYESDFERGSIRCWPDYKLCAVYGQDGTVLTRRTFQDLSATP